MKKIITDDYEFEHIIGGKTVSVDKNAIRRVRKIMHDFYVQLKNNGKAKLVLGIPNHVVRGALKGAF